MVFHMVHLRESLHGGDDLSTGHLFVEGVDKAVRARAIVKRYCERVKLRIKPVCLRAEGETSRHAELRKMFEDRGGGEKKSSLDESDDLNP